MVGSFSCLNMHWGISGQSLRFSANSKNSVFLTVNLYCISKIFVTPFVFTVINVRFAVKISKKLIQETLVTEYSHYEISLIQTFITKRITVTSVAVRTRAKSVIQNLRTVSWKNLDTSNQNSLHFQIATQTTLLCEDAEDPENRNDIQSNHHHHSPIRTKCAQITSVSWNHLNKENKDEDNKMFPLLFLERIFPFSYFYSVYTNLFPFVACIFCFSE